jgi:hypothetical protein
MIALKASEIAQIVGGELIGGDVTVTAAPVFDSTHAIPGSIFLALRGEKTDGHKFIEDAFTHGAVLALVTVASPQRCIVVSDVLVALNKLAAHVRSELKELQVIALTGSQGKTTTKDLLQHILESVGKTVAPIGNFNNELGTPITLLQCNEETKFCILEMGARHIGDIALLCEMAKPNIGMVLRVGTALVNKGRSDPLQGILPDGLELTVKIEIDPDAAMIHVDLSDNPPCVDVGLNTSLGSATSAVVGAIFNALERDLPRNAGSFRRLRFTYAENSVVGAPVFPHSCSMGTTNVAERLVNITQSAFAQLGDGHGLSEGGTGLGAGMAVISGKDHRRGDAPFVNRMMLSTNGGPSSPVADGWVNYAIPVIAGLMYRDSVEVDELKHPIRVNSLEIVQDSSGAGRQRGAPAQQIELAATGNPVTAVISCDGQHAPPRGVVGGQDGTAGKTWLVEGNGEANRLPNVVQVTLQKGQALRGRDSAGGGYGSPLDRPPARVLHDVLEGWESRQKAREIYGVIFSGEIEDETLAVDLAATDAKRKELRA